jgi:hypothetical protein
MKIMKNTIAKIVNTAVLLGALAFPTIAEGPYEYIRTGVEFDNCPSAYVQNKSTEEISMGYDPLKGSYINSNLELKAALGYDSDKFDLKFGSEADLSFPAQEGYVSSSNPSLNLGLFARASFFKKIIFGEVSANFDGAYSSSGSRYLDYKAEAGIHLPMFGASSGKMNGGFGEATLGIDLPQATAKPAVVFGIEFGFETIQ